MHDRHSNKQRYFKEQSYTTKNHIIPYLTEVMSIDENTSILEVGCGEGGNLMPFLDMGCKRIVGVDLSETKIQLARDFYKDHPSLNRIEFISADIYNIETLGKFDLIFTKDVIEHIHDQARFMKRMVDFLGENGRFFLAFPPWYNPFGGHQQMCKSKFLSKLPYFHLLPGPIYKWILKAFGESDLKISNLMEIKETGISIERFEKIIHRNEYQIDRKTYYFINPNYEVKFKLKPRKQAKLIGMIPFIRNFFTTANYYILSVKK